MLLISRASSLQLLFGLLISLLIAVILVPNGTHGARLGDRPRRVSDSPGDLDYPDMYESKDGSSISLMSHFNSTPTKPTPPLSSTTARAVASKIAISDQYTPYMKGMTSPLGEDDLEYSLDYYNEKSLIKEYDFNTTEILKRLVDSAIAQNTPPNQFLEDIQDMISLQNRSQTEQNESSSRDETSALESRFLSENLLKRMTEGWKNELKRLEKKYNVSSECTDSQTITATRLALMFPHYLNFGQKPFAVSTNITLNFGESASTSVICDLNPWNGQRDHNCRYETNNNNYQVPSIFGRQEFGGLIPSPDSFPDATVKEFIMGMHLFALHQKDQDDMVPFRTKCAMLKRRMQKSVLSNERRLRFLTNNDIINKNGTLLLTSISDTYDKIPSNFKAKIAWDLLDSWISES